MCVRYLSKGDVTVVLLDDIVQPVEHDRVDVLCEISVLPRLDRFVFFVSYFEALWKVQTILCLTKLTPGLSLKFNDGHSVRNTYFMLYRHILNQTQKTLKKLYFSWDAEYYPYDKLKYTRLNSCFENLFYISMTSPHTNPIELGRNPKGGSYL